MKRVSKLVTTFAAFVLFFVGVGAQVSAAEVNKNVSLPPVEVEFDLTNVTDVQEHKYIDENGNEVTFGLEPIQEEGNALQKTIPVGTTTYRIYWFNGPVNMEYYIRVNRSGTSAKITDAWGLSVTLIGYSEHNRKFTWSSKRAEYTADARFLGNPFGFSVGLRLTAEIIGTTLKTSVRA